MNRTFKGAFAVVTVLALGSVAASVSARSVPAATGRADLASNAGIFDTSGGAINNTSVGNAWFTIPVVLDPVFLSGVQQPTSYTVKVTGLSTYGTTSACGTHGISVDGLTLSGGANVNIPTDISGAHATVTLPSAYLPAPNGRAWVGCWVTGGSWIDSIDY